MVQSVRYWLYYFLYFSLVSLLFVSLISTEVREEANAQKRIATVAYDSVVNGFRDNASIIFQNMINQPKNLALMAEANHATVKRQAEIREQLYQNLVPMYRNMHDFGLKQLHFHLKNNVSFLRFHRPTKFGDDLTNVRSTVEFVNRSHTRIDGFEEGRIYNGYRYVFPLRYHGEAVGSVETSVSMAEILKSLQRELKQDVTFLMKRSVVGNKVFEDEKSNYRSTPFSELLLYENAVHPPHETILLESILTNWDEKDFSALLTQDQVMTTGFLSEWDLYFVTFYPVKNAVTKEIVALLVFSDVSSLFNRALLQNIALWFLLVVLGFWLLYFYCKARKKNELLQQSLQELGKLKNHSSIMNHLFTIGYWEWSDGSGMLTMNDVARKLFSLGKRQIKGDYATLLSMLEVKDIAQLEKRFFDSVSNKEPYSVNYQLLMPNNEWVHIHEEGVHEFDEEGQWIATRAVMRDDSLQRKLEKTIERLKYEQHHLESYLFEGIYELEYDLSHSVISLNQALESWLGVQTGELSAQSDTGFLDFIHPEDRESVELFFAKLDIDFDTSFLKEHEAFELSYRLVNREGQSFKVFDRGLVNSDPLGRTIIRGVITLIDQQSIEVSEG